MTWRLVYHYVIDHFYISVFKYRELGIGIVSYGPLGHGFFGGKAAVESLSKNSAMVCIL